MSTPYGATSDEWLTFDALLGLAEDLLPVVSDPAATISKTSTMKAIGKTPSRFNRHGQAVGFPDWTSYAATADDVSAWSADDRLGICLQSRHARFIDVDIEDPAQAAEVRQVLAPLCLPTRIRGNSSKFLAAFRLEGDYTKRKIKTTRGIVEFLANGQQAIVAGTHQSGARYEWEGGLPSAIPTLEPQAFEALWAVLVDRFAIEVPTEAGASVKREKLENAVQSDPVAQLLIDRAMVKRVDKSGALHIVCPFEDGHSAETGDSSTTYFPAHTGGYERGHFHCLHASCNGRTDAEFKAAIGYTEAQDALAEFEDLTGAPATEPPADETEQADPLRFKFQSVEEFCARPPMSWMVDGVLPKAELGVLFGESGSGKSFLALDMAAAIAQGLPWRGREVGKGRIRFIAAEGSGGFARRLEAYCKVNDVNRAALDITVLDAAPSLVDRPTVLALARDIKRQGGADLLFVDTLAQSMPGENENSSEGMGKVIANCKGLHKALGCMVVLIHHAGKDSTKGARGWSGLRAACDVELEVVKDKHLRALYVTKQKDGEDGLEFGFRLHQVLAGVDAKGRAVTSCVVEHLDDSERIEHRTKPLGAGQRLVMKAFEAVAGLGSTALEADVLARVVELLPPPEAGKRDTRMQRARQSLRPLIENGTLTREGEHVSLA